LVLRDRLSRCGAWRKAARSRFAARGSLLGATLTGHYGGRSAAAIRNAVFRSARVRCFGSWGGIYAVFPAWPFAAGGADRLMKKNVSASGRANCCAIRFSSWRFGCVMGFACIGSGRRGFRDAALDDVEMESMLGPDDARRVDACGLTLLCAACFIWAPRRSGSIWSVSV
jgi:hypothetical protein